MQLEARKRFVSDATNRMRDYTFPFVTSIMGIVEGGDGEATVTHVGTGLRCLLADRPCVVTAWHVVLQATNTRREPQAGPRYDAFGLSVGINDQVCRIAASRVCFDMETDLAIIPVPSEYSPTDQGPRTSYWQPDRVSLDREIRARDYLFLQGFPGDQSRSLALHQGTHVRSLSYGAMEQVDALPADLKPFQFALPFDAQHMTVPISGTPIDSPPDPRGLSGSPVWRIGASGRSTRDWTPDWSALVGIVTQWRPDDQLLVVSDASEFLELA